MVTKSEYAYGTVAILRNTCQCFASKLIIATNPINNPTRSSPQWWSGARWPRIICSICVQWFGALAKAVRLLIVLLHGQLICVLKCALLTFSSTSNLFGDIWKLDFSTPGLGAKGTRRLVGMAVPISSLLTHMVYISHRFWAIYLGQN